MARGVYLMVVLSSVSSTLSHRGACVARQLHMFDLWPHCEQ
jgi:hypothetical protein